MCFLAWASQRTPRLARESKPSTASGTAESEPEHKIRLTLVLRDSTVRRSAQQAQTSTNDLPEQGNGTCTISTAQVESRNVRARHLQEASSPTTSIAPTRLWQEQVADEVEAALDSLHPTEQAQVMAQLQNILRTRPSTGPHGPALRYSRACLHKCPWSALTYRLDGCTWTPARGHMMPASSSFSPSTTTDSDCWLPVTVCLKILRLPVCFQGLPVSCLLSKARSVQLLSRQSQERCLCLLAYPQDQALSYTATHPRTIPVLALYGQQGILMQFTSWCGGPEHCNAIPSQPQPVSRTRMSTELEVTSWPSLSVLPTEIWADAAGQSKRLFLCRHTRLHIDLDASISTPDHNPAFATCFIVHSGSTPQCITSSWRFFHHGVRFTSWQAMEPMTPLSLLRPTPMTPRQLMTSQECRTLAAGETWCMQPLQTTWALHRWRPTLVVATGRPTGKLERAQLSPPAPPDQGPSGDWSGKWMLDQPEKTGLAVRDYLCPAMDECWNAGFSYVEAQDLAVLLRRLHKELRVPCVARALGERVQRSCLPGSAVCLGRWRRIGQAILHSILCQRGHSRWVLSNRSAISLVAGDARKAAHWIILQLLGRSCKDYRTLFASPG